jgi:hypothetical protein
MRERWLQRVFAVSLSGVVGSVTVPGCTFEVGSGSGDGIDNGTTGGRSDGPGGATTTPEEETDDVFARVDPQEFALASTKASLTTYALFGTIESLGLDPVTLDDETLEELMQQYMPQAVELADGWFATLDPATIPLGHMPKWECTEKFGCAYSTPCKYAFLGHSIPAMPHVCDVTDCGDARCTACPEWFGDLLSHIAFRSWCSYTCIEAGVAYPKTVAIGAGFISSYKNTFMGPWRRDP